MSTSRRSFLKTLAAALVAGPVVAKAALTRKPKCVAVDLATERDVTTMVVAQPRLWVCHGQQTVQVTEIQPIHNYVAEFEHTFAKTWTHEKQKLLDDEIRSHIVVYREWYDGK